MPSHYILHFPSGRSWPTDDPLQWLLDRRDGDLLALARERLTASPDDAERCLRVALRRCSLALVHVVSDVRVVVHHWTDPTPDLRASAKEHCLAPPGVGVSFVNVKTGHVVTHEDAQDVLRYGARVGPTFPWFEYMTRYDRRHAGGAGDHDAAPASFTNFGWPGVPEGRLNWRVLKAIWNAEGVPCPNCDRATTLTAFSWTQGPLSFRSARAVRHCLRCRRRFETDEGKPLEWLASVLPPDQRPTRVRQWRDSAIDWGRLGVRRPRLVQRLGGEG